jgi:AraC-like DNA-binding protein
MTPEFSRATEAATNRVHAWFRRDIRDYLQRAEERMCGQLTSNKAPVLRVPKVAAPKGRPPVPQAKPARKPPVKVTAEQVAALHAQGKPAVQMARELGCSSDLVYRRLKDAGITLQRKVKPPKAPRKPLNMDGAEEMVRRRKLGESYRVIGAAMDKPRESVRYLLVRAAKSDPQLAAVMEELSYGANRPKGRA